MTKQPCRIFNIRAKRVNPGLQIQHIESINAIAKLCNAQTKGVALRSTEMEFYPEEIKKSVIKINIPTAGSIGLVLQPIMIAASLHKIEVHVHGGATNGKWAVPINYLKYVLLGILKNANYKATIDMERYGYYPVGGAMVRFESQKSNLEPFEILEQGDIIEIKGISHASQDLEKANVVKRQSMSAIKELESIDIKKDIAEKYVKTQCPGSGIDLWAETSTSVLGSGSLGERGRRAEDVGKDAGQKLIEQIKSNAPIDEYAADQLIPYMALVGKGKIKASNITDHCRTNIWVTERFMPVKFHIDEKNNKIECKKI